MPEFSITLPRFFDAQQSCIIARWLKAEGQNFAEGDSIAEIETDKATMDLVADRQGKLVRIMADEGEDVKVGQVLCIIDTEYISEPVREEKHESPTPLNPEDEKFSSFKKSLCVLLNISITSTEEEIMEAIQHLKKT
jgi:pyruvate/2-oxoglutarate dehydrogenase complex dihydrolipoamide acyltransferase (E2) component